MADFSDLTAWCAERDTAHLVVSVAGETAVDEAWGVAPEKAVDVGSIQKVVTGVVLGQLLTAGDIEFDTPIDKLLGPGWSNAPGEHEAGITVSHLATMTAGLDDAFAPIHPPGAGWYYCNNGYHLLRRTLERVVGADTDEVYRRRVFAACAMTQSSFVPRFPDDPDSPAALRSTGRDLARFGLALLEEEPFGISRAVIDRMRAGVGPNPSYGHLQWTYRGDRAIVPGHRAGETPEPDRRFGGIELEQPIAAAIPPDAFGGTGFGDQRLTVIPSRAAVVVRVGRATGETAGTFDEAFWARVPVELRRT